MVKLAIRPGVTRCVLTTAHAFSSGIGPNASQLESGIHGLIRVHGRAGSTEVVNVKPHAEHTSVGAVSAARVLVHTLSSDPASVRVLFRKRGKSISDECSPAVIELATRGLENMCRTSLIGPWMCDHMRGNTRIPGTW
ncbi:hypothetical protein GCM10027200_38460 [Lentzea nigeriaca]